MRKRRYRLSEQGLQSLGAAIARKRPWDASTGAKALYGKRISSLNAYRTGMYSRIFGGDITP
jgi:hypothetical protein